MFIVKRRIHLHETDATGALYFAQQFQIALEVFEDYLRERGQPLCALIDQKEYLMPIVHSEADYLAPLRVDDEVTIELKLRRIGTTSFILDYWFYSPKGALKGTVSITHVTMSKSARVAIPVPDELKKCLQPLSEELASKA